MRKTTPMLALGLAVLALTSSLPGTASAASRTWLGVYSQAITDELRDGLDLHGASGVLVNQVVPGSPAADAGLRKGDVITTFNSRSIDSPEGLAQMVRGSNEGREVALGIIRDGEKRSLSVTLGSHSDDAAPPAAPEVPRAPRAPHAPDAPRAFRMNGDDSRELRVQVQGKDGDRKVRVWKNGEEVDPDEVGDLQIEAPEGMRGREGLERPKGLKRLEKLDSLKELDGQDHMQVFGDPEGDGQMRMLLSGDRGRLGVRIESLNEDLASALGAAGSHGALVLEVLKGTPAEEAGLRSGDIITSVEGQSIGDASDLVKTLREQDGKVSIVVVRRGARRTIETELGRAPRTMRWKSGDGMSGTGRMEDGTPHVMIRKHAKSNADQGELREQLDELREQLDELRHELEDKK